MIDKKIIKLEAMKELSRREFFFYCNLMAPNFYKQEKVFLKELCDRLQSFVEGNKKVMVVNMPPR